MHEADQSHLEFSLTRGGPLFAILTSAKIIRHGKHDARRSSAFFAVMTWAPMALFALAHWLDTSTVDPVMRDPAVHVRLLVAIPLFFLAETLIEEQCATSFQRLVEGYVRHKEAAPPIAARAARLRDSWLAEAALFAISVGTGQSALWGILSESSALRGVETHPPLSASFAWYAGVGLPLFQFLLLRSLYRWAIWSRTLISLSCIELDLVPTHPDLVGGIGATGEPVESFAVVVLAASAVLAARWSYRIVANELDPKALATPFVVFVAVVAMIVFGPLLFFSAQLWRARHDGARQYSRFARHYARRFHEKWILGTTDEPLLGTQDICALADLDTVFENVERMRLVPFGPRLAIIIFAATFAPVVPVLAMVQPIPELLSNLGRALLGGLPP